MLDNAITVKPRRQMSVQFSGGEPTLSPYFLDAVPTPARWVITACRQPPTASSLPRARNFAAAAAEAGLRYVYLQFDGIGNAANSHRKVGNLFDVKLQAINNLHEAGVDIVPVTTIINGINNEQVGHIIQFALDNPKKISFLSFQPVSLYGPRRGHHGRTPHRPALHAQSHGPRHQEPGGHRRAGARVVPDQLYEHLLRLGRSDSRTRRGMGPTLLRMPPPTAASAWR